MNSIQGLPLTNIDIAGSNPAQPAGSKDGFGEILKDAVSQIDQAQGTAQTKINEVIQGNGSDLHSAMIAVEKADLSFQLMLQVRNKIVAAYQEVARMNF
jgi:flagellar hook-basal body complex protein FliE